VEQLSQEVTLHRENRPPFTWSEPTRIRPQHAGSVYPVAGLTLPDGRVLIICAADDGTVRRRDVTTGAPQRVASARRCRRAGTDRQLTSRDLCLKPAAAIE
jgi:hypothetical protein